MKIKVSEKFRKSKSLRMLCSKRVQLSVLLLAFFQVSHSSNDDPVTNVLQSILHDTTNLKGNFVDELLFTWLPRVVGQEPSNKNGTKAIYKEFLFTDTSNDGAAHMNVHQLIERSGYKYELYEAVADDGYVTQVTRLINPLADPKLLRKPPVILEHGGTIDPSVYVISSSIQHHPEIWPRTAKDGPITSWNRSLAFVLSNNGFDVWLPETRGSSDKNRKRVKTRALATVIEGANRDKNLTVGETLKELKREDYWDFSQDDIIAHELKSHIDLVLEKTGAKRVHLMTFSLSTPTSLAFLSIRPDYAQKVYGFVSMAPMVSGEGINKFLDLFLKTLCPLLPDKVGTFLITDIAFTQPIRDILLSVAKSRELRYSFIKAFMTLIFGPSAKYQTLMDLNILGHALRELSFREAKQLCQQLKANKLQKFDYGPEKNKKIYGQLDPPVYDLSNLNIDDWITVSGANDRLASPEMLDHLYKIVHPKPAARIIAPGLNHLDLIAGLGNDVYVNLPILSYFVKKSDYY